MTGPPAAPLPDLAGYLARWSTLHGGYRPQDSRFVRTWLQLVYRLARPLAALRVPPSAVTVAGVLVAAAGVPIAAGGHRWPLLVAVVIAVSGILDNLDGAVAVLTDRATAFGYVLDSVADRAADLLLLAALWQAGAPGEAAAAGAAASLLLEYTRARAGAGGYGEIGLVTVGERPTRIIVAVAGLLAAGVLPSQAAGWTTAAAVATAVLAGIALGQLLRHLAVALSRETGR